MAWRRAPTAAASKLGVLAARVESKLAEDLNTLRSRHILPHSLPTAGSPKLDALRGDIAKAQGAAVLAEATSTGWEENRAQSGTRNDWKSPAARTRDP